MMTVRFPNGQAIQYNNAKYVERSEVYTDIYDKKGGIWIAQVPNSCVIEAVTACRVYNPIVQVKSEHLDAVNKELRSIKRKLKQQF